MDLVLNGLHSLIQKLDLLGAITKFIGKCFCPLRREVVLVVKLVLQARPEIHGDGTELHFDLHVALLVFQEDRNFHDQVEASVAARLRIFDVVFSGNKRDVILGQ